MIDFKPGDCVTFKGLPFHYSNGRATMCDFQTRLRRGIVLGRLKYFKNNRLKKTAYILLVGGQIVWIPQKQVKYAGRDSGYWNHNKEICLTFDHPGWFVHEGERKC